MHISCSFDMSYVITFDIWEVRIMSYCATNLLRFPVIPNIYVSLSKVDDFSIGDIGKILRNFSVLKFTQAAGCRLEKSGDYLET